MSGNVLRVLVSLVPLPSAVPVTSSPTSMRWSWFPPEDHISTGRLCSAGSELPTSSPASKLIFSPPTPLPPSAAAPVPLANDLPPGAGACSAEGLGGRRVRLQTRQFRRWITGSPLDRISRGETGPPRLLSHPLHTCRGPTPRRNQPLLAHSSLEKIHGEAGIAFTQLRTLGNRNERYFEATHPRPTCSRAYASPTSLPRPSQGSLPARAGSPLAGRDSHPRDSKQSFMESSQIGALQFQLTSRAWSHRSCSTRRPECPGA